MYIHVNGVSLWYEVAGSGPPVVLLHGNGETHKIFSVLVPRLAESHTVYALDSRCHGQSGKSSELDYGLMTEDVAGFINALELEKPILYGFSDGGIIGLILAYKYPGLLSRLIVSGANLEPDGIRTCWLRLFQAVYAVTRDAKIRMMLTEPHIADEELKRISIPVLVIAGERDLIRREHTEHIASCIPGARLYIVPNAGHTGYVIRSSKLYEIIKDFL